MARPLALLLGLLAAACAAAPARLSALVETGRPPHSYYALVHIADDGSLTTLSNATFGASGIMSGITAPSASTGTWWAVPPFADQAALGLYLVNASSGTTASVALVNPPGCAGSFVVGELQASDVPGDAVALLAPVDSRAWLAVAELSPAGGAPRVRLNLSSEGAGFEDILPSFSAYDAAGRTLWFAAVVGGAGPLVLAAPLDGAADPATLYNASLTMDPLALVYVPALDTVVCAGIVAPPQTYGLQALDRAAGTWRNLTVWDSEVFYLSGLGQATVDPTGRYISIVLAKDAGPVIPVVDATTGREVRRIAITAPDTMIADVGYF